MAYESLGLCAKGEGGKLVDDGRDARSAGASPSTPRAACCARAIPVGATGIAQIVELTEQLQGRVGHAAGGGRARRPRAQRRRQHRHRRRRDVRDDPRSLTMRARTRRLRPASCSRAERSPGLDVHDPDREERPSAESVGLAPRIPADEHRAGSVARSRPAHLARPDRRRRCSRLRRTPTFAISTAPSGRWDRVVRGTHTNVNCVSSCAWNLYVRDGIVWREEQSSPYTASNDSRARLESRAAARRARAAAIMMQSASRLRYPAEAGRARAARDAGSASPGTRRSARSPSSWSTCSRRRGGEGVLLELGPNIDFGAQHGRGAALLPADRRADHRLDGADRRPRRGRHHHARHARTPTAAPTTGSAPTDSCCGPSTRRRRASPTRTS